MKTCVFAGTFDPFTEGHNDVVKKSLKIFDKVIIAILNNPEKSPYFSVEERMEIIRSVYKNNDNVTVESFDGYLVDFMKLKGAKFFIRGIRNGKDLDYEAGMNAFNVERYPEMTTVLFFTEEKNKKISSTLVRERIFKGESISGLVPKDALNLIEAFIKSKRK